MPRLLITLIFTLLPMVCSWAQDFADASVLASGRWRKVSVTTSGVYRLTADALRQMGFSDPTTVRVYGAGGHHLDHAAGYDSRDDITLLPVHHDASGIVFYAEGPDGLTAQSDGSYIPSLNPYTHKAFYYLTTSSASDDVPTASAIDASTATTTISSFDNVYVYAPQSTNIISSGREWVGTRLYSSRTSTSLPISLTAEVGTTARIRYALASDVAAARTLTIAVDGTEVVTRNLTKTTQSNCEWTPIVAQASFDVTSSALQSATISADLTSADDGVWVSYFALTAKSPLDLSDGVLLFRSYSQRESRTPVVFSIANLPSDAQVWDVTDASAPQLQTLSSSSFAAPGRKLHEYVAFSPSATLPSPTDEGEVENQDLHSHQSVNYVVVAPPLLASVAQKFCDLHERANGYTARVVLTTQIYNEFSAGRPEPTAIRNYLKMLYERGGGSSSLKSVFLLGSGSYDNFDLTRSDNLIPTYQTDNSYNTIYSYPIDDFFGWLEDGDGVYETRATVDIGVGRLPAETVAEAETYYSKVQAYIESPEQGDWRARALFVGLQGDSNEHQDYADSQATLFEENNPDMEAIRILCEAYPAVKESTGTSYPQAITAARNHISTGLSLFHYTGHSAATELQGPFLTSDYVSHLDNAPLLPVFVSASCKVAPFDIRHDHLANAGIFNADGGFIAAFAATRDVYGNGNFSVTSQFVKYLYSTDDDGNRLSMGEAMCQAKRNATKGAGSLKYVLLADPALRVTTPTNAYVTLDTVNGTPADQQTEPLKALGSSLLQGSVHLADGSVDTSFNGTVRLTLYDKKQTRQTSGASSGKVFSWEEYATKLFSGRVSVTNGLFSANFILSKEFDLNVGYGRLLMYASATDGRDAMGATDAVLVGDIEETNLTDTIGPDISAWVDYPRDAYGSATSSTPTLYVRITDPQGVNISGQGVGHDISLVIDDQRTDAISLNDYFAYEQSDVVGGLVSYPLTDVSLSSHSFTIKAWDNLNNSSTDTFQINLDPSTSNISISRESLVITDDLQLVISTDALGSALSVHSRLYTTSGILVANRDHHVSLSNGDTSTTVPLAPRLTAPGVYVLHVDVAGNGRKAEISKKIIIGRQ